jgi:mannitol 2-dehydrogenase
VGPFSAWSPRPWSGAATVVLFGDLAQVPRLVEAYGWALDSLHTRGARATLEGVLHGDMKGLSP